MLQRDNKLVALVPMKVHSERIKGKNFKSFAGKPLLHWIIDTLKSIDCIEKVIINTDGKEVLKENGIIESDFIIIRDRKRELCGDYISMNKIIEDDINAVNSDAYLMTHTTNPLLSKKTIKESVDKYYENISNNNYDSLFSVNKYQTRFYKKSGLPVNHDPNNLLRTQDLEIWYEENSNIYIFNKESFKKTNARIGLKPYLFETPLLESMDIDDQQGWVHAEIIKLSQLLHKAQIVESN